MNRVTVMQQHGQSYSVKFLEFTRIYSKDSSVLICVFEGQDEKYFSSRLDSKFSSGRWHGINTGGKKLVMELYDSVNLHPTYSKANFVCFIDRDFEDWFSNKDPLRIYITPCYSIENLYNTEAAFKKILSSEFGVTEFNEHRHDFPACIEAFNSRLNDFLNAVYKFNCWVKAHRIMERDGKISKKLNVRNINTNNLIDVRVDEVKRKYDDSDPESVFRDYDPLALCPNAIKEASDSFAGAELHLAFRGKQQIDFMRAFLLKLKDDRTSNSPRVFSKKGSVTLGLSKSNCISELSQYADTPACLDEFLDTVVYALAA